MDYDLVTKRNRFGRLVTTMAVLPDADISDCASENEDDATPQEQTLRDTTDIEEEVDEEDQEDEEEVEAFHPDERNWSHIRKPREDITFLGNEVLENSENEVNDPIWYFKQYFNDEMISLVTNETNKYAAQQTLNITTSPDEIEVLLGIMIKMGIIGLPRFEMYWSNDYNIASISDKLSRNRFWQLNKVLHFADNTHVITDRENPNYGRLSKIRRLLTMLNEKCRKMTQFQHHAVDEQIIPFKGRASLKQYLPKKPKRWGIKVFSRNADDGFMHDFCIYEGKPVTVEDSCGKQPGDIVLKLCCDLQDNIGHVVYFDNYFNFFSLQSKLHSRGIFSVGTLRKDRVCKAPIATEKELKKKGRGSFDCFFNNEYNVSLVTWFDNRAVLLSSTHLAVDPVVQVKRFDKKEKQRIDVPCPIIVYDYNQHMGAIDKFDMLMSYYRIKNRTTKWYRAIFYWCLNASIVNAWLHYRRHCSELKVLKSKQMDLLEFTSNVSSSLMTLNKTLQKSKKGRPSLSAILSPKPYENKKRKLQNGSVHINIQKDQIGHFPEMVKSQSRQRCKECSTLCQTKCLKCCFYLCLRPERNCFLKFHT